MIKITLIPFYIFFALGLFGQQSFSLNEAIAYGLENSRTLKIKQLDIITAHEDINDFKAFGMPQVTGNINYQYYFSTPSQPIADFITPSVYNVLFDEEVLARRELGPPETFELSFVQPHVLTGSLEASFILFDGSYLAGLKAAKLYKDLIAKDVDATEQEIKSNITKAYMAVLIAEENIEIIENNIRTVDKSLKEITIMYREGFAESLDVDRLTLSHNNLNTEKEKLQGLIEVTKNLLKFQIGFPIIEAIDLTENIEKLVGTYNLETIAINDPIDYSQRAEYDVITTSTELNRMDLKRHKNGYLPSLKVFANAQQALQRGNLFDGDEAGWLPTVAAGVGLKIPIYDGGEKSARIQKSKVNIEKSNLQLEDFKSAVELQVYNARISFLNAKKSVANTLIALEINQNIFNKTQIKFKEGVGSSVEVTQAESSLYNAQGSYINALYDLVTAKTDLDIALGNL